jgi:outer membrane protein
MSIKRIIGGMIAAVALLASGPATVGEYDDNFMVRVQGTAVITQDKLKSLDSSTLGDLKALGFDAEVSNEIVPTATLTYFFNKNLAVELFCCFSTHAVDLKPPAAFAGLAGEIAESWIFPPILTLQYHFTGLGAFKP